MSVLRVGGGPGNFFIRVTLEDGAEFDEDDGTAPVLGDVTQTDGLPAGNIGVTIVAGGTDEDTFVDFLIDVPLDFTAFPTFEIDTDGWGVADEDNVLGDGGAISVTVSTRDSNTGTPIDVGDDTVDWLFGERGIQIPFGPDSSKFISTSATIDVASLRLEFVPDDDDDAKTDAGASVGLDETSNDTFAPDGTPFELAGADDIDVIIRGDLSGITEIVFGATKGDEVRLNRFDTEFDVANGIATLTFDGDANTLLTGTANEIECIVDEETSLNPRVLTIQIFLNIGSPSANDRDLLSERTVTTWRLNGTVLIANFMNGNNGLFNSRIYLFNPGSLAGDITIRVFTLPLAGPSTVLGVVNVGVLPGLSGRNIRLAEDVLTPLSIALPYVADGGNLVVEVTVEASSVTGNGQVFQLDLSSFGIYNLQPLD